MTALMSTGHAPQSRLELAQAERIIKCHDLAALDEPDQRLASSLTEYVNPPIACFPGVFTETVKALVWAKYAYDCGYIEAVRDHGMFKPKAEAPEYHRFLEERTRFHGMVHPLALWGFNERIGHFNSSTLENSGWGEVARDIACLESKWRMTPSETVVFLTDYSVLTSPVGSVGTAFLSRSANKFSVSAPSEDLPWPTRLWSLCGGCGLITAVARVLLETGNVTLAVNMNAQNLVLDFESSAETPPETARQKTLQLAAEITRLWGGRFSMTPGPLCQIHISLPVPDGCDMNV